MIRVAALAVLLAVFLGGMVAGTSIEDAIACGGPCPPTTTETTTSTTTTTTTSTETTTGGERCPPGMTPTAGKDGEPGNDECEFPETPPVTTTVTTSPPPETTVVTVTSPASTVTETVTQREPDVTVTDTVHIDATTVTYTETDDRSTVPADSTDSENESAGPPVVDTTEGGSLPNTGVVLWIIAALGVALLVVGLVLRRWRP